MGFHHHWLIIYVLWLMVDVENRLRATWLAKAVQPDG